jgi:hypothetical protein
MNPGMVLPKILTDVSSNTDSAMMAIIGPNIIALGDIVFMTAHTSPARQKSPFSRHK